MLVEYFTVAKQAQDTIVAKKSKFIANVAPVSTGEQAEEFIAKISKQHNSASHNVPAYIVGLQAEIQKCSDDGEPSNTAGSPILEVLKAHQLVNVVVVVTRYFGGTLLGRGGLIRAYGKAAQAGLSTAGMVKMVPQLKVSVTVDYSLSGKVQSYLMQTGVMMGEIDYLADVTFNFQIEPHYQQRIYQQLQEISADTFQWTLQGEEYRRQPTEIGGNNND